LEPADTRGRRRPGRTATPPEPHLELRSSGDRRGDGSGIPEDAETDAGKPVGDALVKCGMRSVECGMSVPGSNPEFTPGRHFMNSAFRIPHSALGGGVFAEPI